MTFGLAPGKLGFKLGEVLVGLQSGTTDTPETISSTQNKLHTVPYMWNPDTLAYEVPVQALTDAELRAAPVPCYAYPLEYEVAHTAALNGVNARLYHIMGRSFLGAGANTTFELSHLTLPAGATVKISAIPGSAPAGNKLDASFTIICVGM